MDDTLCHGGVVFKSETELVCVLLFFLKSEVVGVEICI